MNGFWGYEQKQYSIEDLNMMEILLILMVNFIEIYENKKPVTNKPMSYDIMHQRKITTLYIILYIIYSIYYIMYYIWYIKYLTCIYLFMICIV